MSKKDDSIGALFQAGTKYRRGQLPSRTGKLAPSLKVYANPLEVASLPIPDLKGGRGIWQTLSQAREQIPEGGRIHLPELGQILWATAGFTYGKQRTHIAAGPISSLEVYLIVRQVQDMFAGVYHYSPRDHSLEYLLRDDMATDLEAILLGDTSNLDACAAILAFTGLPARHEDGAKSRAYRYLYLEAGAAAQCAVSSAVAMDLVASFKAEFYDDELARLLSLDVNIEFPLCVVTLGT